MFSSVCALPSPASAEGMLPFVVPLVHWYYDTVRLLLYVPPCGLWPSRTGLGAQTQRSGSGAVTAPVRFNAGLVGVP
jgi:hypothetical protein